MIYQYRIEYTRSDMPEDYVARSVKYAKDEATAVRFLGGKPDKQGFFRLKKGGMGKMKSITKL